uniref:Ubiquitin-like domain-containing protein n=1 Tax=Panagrolaimus sp. PS1159 TaxID=55785 RepID=A0AC35FIU1_9BILA
MGNLYFEVLRGKTHFLCDYPEDATPIDIKKDIQKFLNFKVEDQVLKVQTISGEENDWNLLDDNKKLADQGLNTRVAKADSPLSIALIVTSREKDINIERMSSPPPMPEAMRNRENPENEA